MKSTDQASLEGVCMIDVSAAEDLVSVDIFLYNIDVVDWGMIRELVMRSAGKLTNTVRQID